MSETLLILGALLGFAIVVQLFCYHHRNRRLIRCLEQEIDSSTQVMYESRRRIQWLEERLEDLLDAAQFRSGDPDEDWTRLDRAARSIKEEARQKGYRLGLGDLDSAE
jgi:hypothetical protein